MYLGVNLDFIALIAFHWCFLCLSSLFSLNCSTTCVCLSFLTVFLISAWTFLCLTPSCFCWFLFLLQFPSIQSDDNASFLPAVRLQFVHSQYPPAWLSYFCSFPCIVIFLGPCLYFRLGSLFSVVMADSSACFFCFSSSSIFSHVCFDI